ncbi:MAG: hypothetical protein UY70_C0007G0014 [Candidatus Kaiserbacteria bacterium GW2011_GWB1_52_6]|uniref:Uncharacterized protein n=3 Tax=Candidatus Kaiseribacteriota TaxID=1752734 RepID=A0A0G1ZU49_9BACT|nr:MAG: hypothetical protein UY67_C0014G0008 [Candidatus Kaiserbacteria bacterium GW2011_GWA2_52_12]KKW27803.1 MAG: hypothetical protein UY70_C0007G0014 [Candidatus Kaiserbacteria bacterium GW2011_GWB1_52_6]KKW31842.1 MAG: hypothetical protein UY74_C0005G0008 [Candidatus Kaiserbacteria bacterium GW2011_GWC2_52_8b]
MTSKRNMAFFTEVEPPEGLFKAVLARIALARRRAARIKLAALGTVILVSGAALVPAVSYAVQEFYTSGFYDYLSLFFSDSSVAFSHWQEISLSLAESLPSLAVLLLVGFAAAFLWSLRRAVRNAGAAFNPIRLA